MVNKHNRVKAKPREENLGMGEDMTLRGNLGIFMRARPCEETSEWVRTRPHEANLGMGEGETS